MKISYLDDLKILIYSIAEKIKEQFIGKSNLETAVSDHNTSHTSHEDIRELISTLTNRLNDLADSDDETLDQLSEIVAYIKNNKDLIEGVTTSKVNVSDIINSLNSDATDKPLAAKQGEILKGLIEDLKKSVSDGKSLVADAITEKGVETAANASFSTMAENIGQIETGDNIMLQSKTVSPSASVQTINPDSGYGGLSQVTVQAIVLQSKSVVPTTSAQTVTPDAGKDGLSSVNVGAIQLQEKTVTPSTSAQNVTPDSGQNGLSKVTVNAAKLQSKTVTPSASVQTINPDNGYLGLSKVVVNAQQNTTPESITIVGKLVNKVQKSTGSISNTKTSNFSKTLSIPLTAGASLASCTAGNIEGAAGYYNATATVTVTGISFETASAISMISEHMGVNLATAQQMYDAKDVLFEFEEDVLETSKVQKVAEAITGNEKLVSQSKKLASGVHDAAISDAGETVSGLVKEGGQ